MLMSNESTVFERVFTTREKLEEAIQAQEKILEGNKKRLEIYKQLYKRYDNE